MVHFLARLFFGLALLCPRAEAVDAPDPVAPVTVETRADRVILANGLVTAELAPQTGNLLSFRLGERELLAEPGYLDWQDGRQRRLSAATLGPGIDPRTSADGHAEICFVQPWSRQATDVALDVSLHYVLMPGERSLRTYVTYRHPADYPAAGFGQSRYVLRVNEALFDVISVDAARTHRLPPSSTPTQRLGPKESMRFTAGAAQGDVTDKYHYFTDSGGHFFHGWMGAESSLGLWIVYGSTEDQNGGPTRQHNTAHWPRVLLKILSCGHYGAPGVAVAAGETWEKVYGPWALYANEAATLVALRADAARQAEAEQAAFPPAWLQHPAFPPASGRGEIHGRLLVNDPWAPAQTAAGAWVGLAAAAPDWQRQSLGYQTWVRADADGRFRLSAVRPGRYTLYAFTDGVLGEFRQDNVEVGAAQAIALGDLAWVPLRHGPALWQIGTPDRTAREFRHGDDYRRWGLWLEYAKDFPEDVVFTIGKSDPRRDWNFSQITRLAPDGKTYVGTTWRVIFDVDTAPPAGDAVLRFAFAGTHNASLHVCLDEQPLGNKPQLGSDNAVARAGIHGQYYTWDLSFPAALLTPGRHVLDLEQKAAGSPFKNLMYDCVRLEVPAAVAAR